MSARLTIGDLAPKYQEQIAKQLGGGPLGMARSEAVRAVPIVAVKPRIRQNSGDGMNKTERRYDGILRASWDYVYREPSLPLANGLKYKLDFLVVGNGGRIEGHEVKGRAFAAGIVKVKMAARLFPWIKFFLVTAKKGGEWQIDPVLP